MLGPKEKLLDSKKYNNEEDENWEPDAHCCSLNTDAEGYCEICGAAVPGTIAYSELYGGE